MSSETLLLTATVQPGDIIFCDRRDADLRLRDYLHALRFWLGESEIKRIVLVENSGFDLSIFHELVRRHGRRSQKIELITFRQPPFDKNLGKSYGEAKIIEYALKHSTLLAEDTFVLKGTGRYYPTNFFKIWPLVRTEGYPFVLANFYNYPAICDSRYFGAHKDFLRNYFLPATQKIDDSKGFYFEHALAAAVQWAISDNRSWRTFPRGGLLVDGVQASTNTMYAYPGWKRLLYRGIACVRNGLPFRLHLDAPIHKPGQGSQT